MNVEMLCQNTITCTGCMACANSCPQQCISMSTDAEGFYYPHVEIEECSECGVCVGSCPLVQALPACTSIFPHSYAVVHHANGIRKKSSSGGFFSAMANYVLQQEGVVFGAAFTSQWSVAHRSAQNREELQGMLGSKYVQSYIGNTYTEAKQYLDMGKMVLFSGTPCQIAGLQTYLGALYDNLITVDFICHGVPSPLVWSRYIAKMCSGRDIRAISFRDKRISWEEYTFSVRFQDGTFYSCGRDKDLYLKGFLADLYLRPSCYSCLYKTFHRSSDFTMADFWGIDDILPNRNDHKGISLVFVQNPDREYMLADLDVSFIQCDLSKEQIRQYNSAMLTSVKMNSKRDRFFAELQRKHKSIDALLAEYLEKSSGWERAVRYIKRLLRNN